MAGSVQVVSSTNGELGPGNDDTHLVDRRTGVPLNSQPEVEIVDETKYDRQYFKSKLLLDFLTIHTSSGKYSFDFLIYLVYILFDFCPVSGDLVTVSSS